MSYIFRNMYSYLLNLSKEFIENSIIKE